ncbi:hypothetical protein BD410DRAFT_781228 [Rickenella mellea]|uniref:Uncharacterized protein n=1 Tax=Rickenella mellea TaxID=50990 RepID=A0A4Y7QP84_9AGAM|nr:hypothetical protein BD410DRAFT_781228 [Rickenella mellea]
MPDHDAMCANCFTVQRKRTMQPVTQDTRSRLWRCLLTNTVLYGTAAAISGACDALLTDLSI